MNDLRIIFLGTSDFAVDTLEILLDNGINVVAVVTIPDKPQGRGQKLVPSPIKVSAIERGIPLLQPKDLKDPKFLKELKSYNSNLQVVVAFKILPEIVWNMPKLGTVNLHASLLPQYRGAAPINWAIIHGEEETGVTTFFLDNKMDTGNIAYIDYEPIYPTDNAGDLYKRLKKRGSSLMLKTVRAIEAGNCPKQSQPKIDKELLYKAPKIHKANCKIDWNNEGEYINNFVRGLAPYPAAWTILNGKKFKIFDIELLFDNKEVLLPGQISSDKKTYINVGTSTLPISIKEIQLEGKKKMYVDDFLRGNPFK